MRLIALSVLLASLWTVPVNAQNWGGYDPSPFPAAPRSAPAGVGRELNKTRADIRKGRDAGQLTRREARGLRREGRAVEGLSGRFAVGGLSDAEAAELRVRSELLHAEVVARRSRGLERPR